MVNCRAAGGFLQYKILVNVIHLKVCGRQTWSRLTRGCCCRVACKYRLQFLNATWNPDSIQYKFTSL